VIVVLVKKLASENPCKNDDKNAKDILMVKQQTKLEWEKDVRECDKFVKCMLEQDQSKTKPNSNRKKINRRKYITRDWMPNSVWLGGGVVLGEDG
jgi:hypothetical protein